jgi:hypothetical protein
MSVITSATGGLQSFVNFDPIVNVVPPGSSARLRKFAAPGSTGSTALLVSAETDDVFQYQVLSNALRIKWTVDVTLTDAAVKYVGFNIPSQNAAPPNNTVADIVIAWSGGASASGGYWSAPSVILTPTLAGTNLDCSVFLFNKVSGGVLDMSVKIGKLDASVFGAIRLQIGVLLDIPLPLKSSGT